jgi:hypothetical protein
MKTITFRVNLETVDRQGFLQPNRTTLSGNETVSEADNMRATRTVYIPGLLHTNIQGIAPKGYLRHGDTFTATDSQAIYLKNTYVLGKPDDVLQIVSED